MNAKQKMIDLLDKAISLYSYVNSVHPAANLFPMMDEDEFQELVDDADKNGFLHPVRITDNGELIDGRNRICASIILQKDVRVERYNPVDPIQYVISENLKRRHLNSQQKAAIAVEAEELYALFAEQAKERQKEAGRFEGKNPDGTPKLQVSQKIDEPEKESEPVKPQEKRTDTKIARSFGTNRDYVSKAKKVKQHAPELLEDVKSGKTDLNVAVKVAKEREKEIKGAIAENGNSKGNHPVQQAIDLVVNNPKLGIEEIEIDGYKLNIWHKEEETKSPFNQANDSIDWAWSTWNPVTGCLHSCSYCYARDIATSDRMSGVYPKGFEPVFHPYRLDSPKYSKHYTDDQVISQAKQRKLNIEEAKLWAKNVFVCSMADLFGKWVPDEWILAVFDSVKKYNDWNYLFLTKYPQRLEYIGEKLGGSFPDNCWVGTTVDEQKRVKIAQSAFENIKAPVKWLSLEPLLSDLHFGDLAMFDMVAIGGQSSNSQVSEFQPEWKWVENILFQARLSDTAVYFKENLKSRPKELPF